MIIKEDGPPCNCGARGCLEALASGVAIYRQVERLASMNVDSPMVEDFMKDPLAFEAGDVCRHADEGDRFALSVLRDAGRYLGIGIATLINIFNPDAVTLSGGLLGCFHHMEEEMQREVRESAIPISGKHARILRGILGEDTGPLGAALLTREGTTR
jgi:glucokinase